MENREDENTGQTRHGGFMLLGPIPLVWGSDKPMIYLNLVLLAIAVVLVLAFLFF